MITDRPRMTLADIQAKLLSDEALWPAPAPVEAVEFVPPPPALARGAAWAAVRQDLARAMAEGQRVPAWDEFEGYCRAVDLEGARDYVVRYKRVTTALLQASGSE